MKDLTLIEEIIRDIESANKRRNSNRTENLLSWKNWLASDIFETYNISSNIVKAIIKRAIKTDGASLEVDISKLEKAA